MLSCVGSGIMTANLGAMLKLLDPALTIQVYEVTEELAQESSNGWNNAGTGHAGICELSYTPFCHPDGHVNVEKAIEVFEEFEYSLQFWSYDTRMLNGEKSCWLAPLLPGPPSFSTKRGPGSTFRLPSIRATS